MHAFWLRMLSGAWRLLSVLVGLAMLAGALAWMSGALHEKVQPGVAPREQPLAAGRTLVPVETLQTTESIDVVGTVQPRHKSDVASQILALVREVKVNPADRVQTGQLLVVLDDREVLTHLREAEAALAGAQADLDVKLRDFTRYDQLYRGKTITKQEYDRAEGAYKGAQSQIRRVEEQVARASVMVTYTEVKAQTAGIVADRYVDPGDLAVPGKPLLTLHDPQVRELHASVPESMASAVKVGMELPVRVEAVKRECHGVVREIVPQALQASRSLLVKLTLPPEAVNRVYIGMFGRVSIPVGQADRVVVPAAAVQAVGQQDLVEVASSDGALQRCFVTTGRRYDDKVEILSGLSVGQKVALPEKGLGIRD